MAAQSWQPYESLTKAPTNLKEAIDWVLRVTGKDGKKNEAASPPQFSCICFLSKSVKDLLYDARSPGSPGPHPDRNWDELLLGQEKDIVKPVLTDLGLVNGGSTGAASSTCAGGTEVIKTLIDQLAQGLQKWVGWQDQGDDCCLKGTEGIGKKCDCPSGGGVSGCCTGGTKCHECGTCGTSGSTKCYLSAYCKKNSTSGGGGASTEGQYYWPSISSDCTKVHLLARIFLGSVCLIWSGLSQLGFLTKEGSGGTERWSKSKLHDISTAANAGLGSFMAAMGYDLERLNQGGVPGSEKKGSDVWKLLSGTDNNKSIKWQEFKNVPSKGSVAEYYSSIYDKAKEKNTEKICEKYPLLVLHILASGYFRAGSAGANKVPVAPKAATSTATKDTAPRNPRTIREILYWLSALPYSKGYCQLVTRMQQKTDQVTQGNDEKNKNKIVLHDENSGKNTELNKDCITHYLMAACGYCPLVLIGIQGTINTSGTDSDPAKPGPPAAGSGSPSEKKKCPHHKDNRNHRCDPKDIKTEQAPAPAAAPSPGAPTGEPLKEGQVCYGGYHLEVSQFGPLHGMYANGLFGFQMDLSAAQCLDQLRVYVYHCFYQLYFLRKQCKEGVVDKAGNKVLGWKSCRYGKDVKWSASTWLCSASSTGTGNDCQCKKTATPSSPLMTFLCDGIKDMRCGVTAGKSSDSETNPYPEIEEHMEAKDTIRPPHVGKAPMHCPVPMGWSAESTSSGTTSGQVRVNHFKDITKGTHKTAALTGGTGTQNKYPAHCTGNTLSLLLEYYCDPGHCPSGTLVVLLRLLACITPTVPQTLGDLFGFYYYIVYIGGQSGGQKEVHEKLKGKEGESRLKMPSIGGDAVVKALEGWNKGDCSGKGGNLKCLTECDKGAAGQCSQYLSPLSGQQYGQLSPAMAGTYLSWLVYLIEKFEDGLKGLAKDYRDIVCRDNCSSGQGGAGGCSDGNGCRQGTHGTKCTGGSNGGVCGCASVVSCTGVLPVLYKYGFGYGNVETLHKTGGVGNTQKKCHEFLSTLNGVLEGNHLKKDGSKGHLHHEINKLIYTTRLPWIFVLTLAWLVAVLYLAFGAIWPLDWTHMRSHCRGWFRKGSLSPWEVLMVGKKKGRGILEFFGGR